VVLEEKVLIAWHLRRFCVDAHLRLLDAVERPEMRDAMGLWLELELRRPRQVHS
jgi:hypothetical protein